MGAAGEREADRCRGVGGGKMEREGGRAPVRGGEVGPNCQEVLEGNCSDKGRVGIKRELKEGVDCGALLVLCWRCAGRLWIKE